MEGEWVVVDARQMNRDETPIVERFGVSGWKYNLCPVPLCI